MKIDEIIPPRRFGVPSGEIRHCANIVLESDEQVTFVTPAGKEYDVVKKSWGFFATPSINSRLKRFGYRAALVADSMGKQFVCLVEEDKVDDFSHFLQEDRAKILCWIAESSDDLTKT